MNLIIPLGGLGTRFKKDGYSLPKPLINVLGKPILYWLLDNLNLEKFDQIIIPYHRDLATYNFEDKLRKDYSNTDFLFNKLGEDTEGASHTLLYALDLLSSENLKKPCLSLDGDNSFQGIDIFSLWNGENSVFCFEDKTDDEAYSFVKSDENDVINDIIEKVRISNYACCGGYGFSSGVELRKYIEFIMENKIQQKFEYYTSTVIKEMIKNDHTFKAKKIPSNSFICLGTPLHVRFFTNNYPAKDVEKKRYCFDLDETLVSFPKVRGDYSSVKPIQKNIELLRYLKNLGHYIIIHTARRMKTHDGNEGKLIRDIGKVTFNTLDKFDIPYDELYFGKPYADYYIDDKAISAFADLEKETGFYKNSIEPRSFNQLNSTTVNLYRKHSDSGLDGEIYYYNNIQDSLKDLFPIFFRYDKIDYRWYEVEKIEGLTASIIYTNNQMSNEILTMIFLAINRIHLSSKTNNFLNLNIYDNYLNKLEKRYEKYDYSVFPNSKQIYEELKNGLLEYENGKKGLLGQIHGDTVLTNIIVNKFKKVKFIDMRGEIDGELSILGDVFYDWAKLYQSLIGYDEILLNKPICLTYKKSLIKKFTELFLEKYTEQDLNNVKLITKSLLFTLLPLHDNENCFKFYDLIFSEFLI